MQTGRRRRPRGCGRKKAERGWLLCIQSGADSPFPPPCQRRTCAANGLYQFIPAGQGHFSLRREEKAGKAPRLPLKELVPAPLTPRHRQPQAWGDALLAQQGKRKPGAGKGWVRGKGRPGEEAQQLRGKAVTICQGERKVPLQPSLHPPLLTLHASMPRLMAPEPSAPLGFASSGQHCLDPCSSPSTWHHVFPWLHSASPTQAARRPPPPPWQLPEGPGTG